MATELAHSFYVSCNTCGKNIPLTNIDSHERTCNLDVKQNQEYIICSHKSCNLPIPINEIESHQLAHDQTEMIPCDYPSCGQMIPTNKYNQHITTHKQNQNNNLKSDESIPCEVCGLQIPIQKFNSHTTEHEREKNNSIYVKCTEPGCKAEIKQTEFEHHKLFFHPKPKEVIYIICTICNQKIPEKEYNDHKLAFHDLLKPSASHENIAIKCDYPSCSKQIPFDEYKAHQLWHQTQKQKEMVYIICTICNQKIPEKEYDDHKLAFHDLLKPPISQENVAIKCDYPSCSKEIPFDEYKQHQLWHQNQEQQAQIECEYKGCNQMIALCDIQQHQLAHQRQDAENKLVVMQQKFKEMENQLQHIQNEKKQVEEKNELSVKEKEKLKQQIETQQKQVNELQQNKQNAEEKVAEFKQQLESQKSHNIGVEYPKWWNINVNSVKHAYGEVKLIELDLNNVKGKQVIQEFNKTATNEEIIKIECVVNRILYDEWWNSKKILSKAIGENKLNERLLFHGCRTETVMYNEIVKEGFKNVFNKGYSYGMGTYFAKNAQYSVGYSSNNNGIRKMFCCEVVCGESAQGNSGIKLTSWPKKSNGLIYDSLVDNVASPSIFVIYKDNRIYPMFILSFKQK